LCRLLFFDTIRLQFVVSDFGTKSLVWSKHYTNLYNRSSNRFLRRLLFLTTASDRKPANLSRPIGRLKALSLVALAALAACALQRPPEVRYPLKDEIETLNARASAQKQTSGQFEVSHNFHLRIAGRQRDFLCAPAMVSPFRMSMETDSPTSIL
jgi:hypothetical protein